MYMPSIFGESLFDNMFPFDEKFFTEKIKVIYASRSFLLEKMTMTQDFGSTFLTCY